MTGPGTEIAPRTAVPFRPGVLEIDPEGGGRLVGARCPSCGAHFFPYREVCSGCLTEDLERVPLSARGTLYTYTVIHQSTPEFPTPYVLAYVDLPEGVRILGQVSGAAEDEVRIGMPLALSVETVGTDEEGREVIGYRFRPDRGEADRE